MPMIDDKLKELEEIEREYQVEDNYLDDYIDTTDITKLYLKEICNYPLLTIEEEQEIGNNLKLANNLKIAIFSSNKSTFELNLPLVFKSLFNNNSYNEIIENLLSYYKTKSSDKLIYEKIKSYSELSKKLNRPLNDTEIKEFFYMNTNNLEILSEEELLEEINNYLIYKKSFDKMFNSNLRLVVSVARRYYRDDLEILDLISEGNLGLAKAIGNFDVSLGFKFSTYAIWYIRKFIRSFVSSEANKLRIPNNLNNYIIKLKKDISILEQEYQKKLSLEEISKLLNIEIDKLVKYLSYEIEVKSLNQTFGEDDDSTLEEFIPNKENIEKTVLNVLLKEDIKELYTYLSKKELDVIKMRYGLDEYAGMNYSLNEIGKKYNVTRQYIKKIEDKALRKMKVMVKREYKCSSLKDYLEK
ncbi:MAG: sigma-70 family RNA polymerase sigma factor [Lactobacillales bacterium]|nr:sigma-70 family RNA polymerase sigma factor [Lactobacillales bacterium]